MPRPLAHVLPAVCVVLAAAVWVASCGPASLTGRGGGQPEAAGPSRPGTPPGSRPAPSPSASLGGPAPSASPAAPSPATPSPSPSAPSPSPAGRATAKPSPGPSAGQSRRVALPAIPPGCDDQHWRSGAADLTRHIAVPPTPFLTGIKMGTHPDCGFDRIVLHFPGRVPGYQIRYVSGRAAGRAARSLVTRGDHYLMITVYPAQSHRRSGASTVSPTAAGASFPVLRGFSVASDFEGVVSVVAVVAKAPPFRVGILPKRLYVDVAG